MSTISQLCPNCLGRGEQNPLKRLFINFEETVIMCSATHCTYISHDTEHQTVPMAPESQPEPPAPAADDLDDFDTFLNSLYGPAADSGVEADGSASSGLASDASRGGSSASNASASLVSSGLASDASRGGSSASNACASLVGSGLISDSGRGWSSTSEVSLVGSVASEPCRVASAPTPQPAPAPRSLPDPATARRWRRKARESRSPPPGLALRAFNNTAIPHREPQAEDRAGGSGAGRRPARSRSRRPQPGVYVVTGERFRQRAPVWERAAVPPNTPNSLTDLLYGPAEVRRIRRRLRRHAAARRPPAAAEAAADALQRLQVASPAAANPRQLHIPPTRVRRPGPSAQDVAAALDRSLSQAGDTRDLQRRLGSQQVYVRTRQVARMKAWAKKRAAPAR